MYTKPAIELSEESLHIQAQLISRWMSHIVNKELISEDYGSILTECRQFHFVEVTLTIDVVLYRSRLVYYDTHGRSRFMAQYGWGPFALSPVKEIKISNLTDRQIFFTATAFRITNNYFLFNLGMSIRQAYAHYLEIPRSGGNKS